ncbi:low affinity tryptophan permease TnaB [Escherichia coli]|nr:low affinity tryptophan permease TnaB [Escherichia coli]NWN17159.1 low affinity tryptophan permease TnaB [Escherichia coli]
MTDQAEKKHSAFWGVMVIAGTVIGGGMFALPVDLAGAWFFWGAFILIIAWFSMLHSGLLLLEANLNYPVGSSFNTITKDLIGNTWNIISGITVAFVLYILTYAYISANGAIISETISMNLGYHANPRIVGICTAIFVASVLWISSLAASRITSLFLGLKIISFVIVFGSFFFQVDYSILRDATSTTAGTSYSPYIFMALPVCLASFGFHGNIPSLIICYGKRKDKLIKSVVFGSLLALVIYLFWLYCTMGNIPRESFKAIISSGGNVDSLVKSFLGTKQHGIIEFCLLVFSNLAVASSFFGVTLGLFDYLAGMAAAMLFAGKVADRSGRKPVAIPGAALFIIASVFCSLAETSTLFLAGRFLQGLGAGCCYVVAFAILRDTLDDRRRAKVLSLLNGITCIIPVLAPVLGHLIMLKFPWQSLFWTMATMGIAVLMLSLFILKETRPAAPTNSDKPRENSESLLNRFFLSRVVITTLSVSVILTFVNTSPVLLMEIMGFERGEYATIMALTAGVSMTVSFSTPFALGIFKPRTLMITSQVLFLAAGITLAVSPSHAVSLFGITLICAGFSVGFGVAMSQALGPFSLRAGVASSTLGIAQVCGSSLWIWLAAVVGIGAWNMLIGILIACSIVSLLLIMFVAPGRPVAAHEEIHHHA